MAKNKTNTSVSSQENIKSSEIIFVVDRSGSMGSIRDNMQSAIKEILDDQKKLKQSIKVTHAQFDWVYEECFVEKPIEEISDIPLEPRGSTALIDAICTSINNVEKRYLEKEESQRPDRILFVVVTDGQENASHEFDWAMAKSLKDRCEKYYGWNVTLVGTASSLLDGGRLGIERDQTLCFNTTSDGVARAARSVSTYTTQYLSTGQASYTNADQQE